MLKEDNMKNIIVDEIRELFLREADNAPLLMSDLAHLESYISESYSGRSVIELLQNADDAKSDRFTIEVINESTILFANDGLEFTSDDILAICRSGESNKVRNGGTIGYRGIGFKSIVNYAEEAYLFSGDFSICFSKCRTRESLSTLKTVPLIRIPHPVDNFYFDKYLEKYRADGYTTIFIFSTKRSDYLEELTYLDKSILLFLNHVTRIEVKTESYHSVFKASKSVSNGYQSRLLTDSFNQNELWRIYPSNVNSNSSVAVLMQEDRIAFVPKEHALFHSFLPTEEHVGFHIKANSDFSTDPSRKKIINDEYTNKAIDEIVEILHQEFKRVFYKGIDSEGFISVITSQSNSAFPKYLGFNPSNELINRLNAKNLEFLLQLSGSETSLTIRPTWLTEEDYLAICKELGIFHLSELKEDFLTALLPYMKVLGIKSLDLIDALKACQKVSVSHLSAARMIGELDKYPSLVLYSTILSEIKKSRIFKVNGTLRAINDDSENITLDTDFFDLVLENTKNRDKLLDFLNRLNIAYVESEKPNHMKATNNHGKGLDERVIKTYKNSVSKWRSVEKNLAEILQSTENVVSSKDVGKENIGYDLELTFVDGSKKYVEVKSVKQLGDSVALTNNEYSTATHYMDRYVLVIAKQSEFEIEYIWIDNPVLNLNIYRRVARWEWACEEYSGQLFQYKLEG